MIKKKTFFKERTVNEISALEPETVGVQGLVERIQELSSEDSIILQAGLTPTKFWRGTNSSATASRRNLKHGFYSWIDQPHSKTEAERTEVTPLKLRQTSIERALARPEENVFCLGYSFRPIVGRDRRRIYIPFWSVMDGCKRDTYDQFIKDRFAQLNCGSSIETYDSANRVNDEGAEVIVKVSSSTKGKGRYRLKWRHVCVKDNDKKRVICWGTKPTYEKDELGSDGEPTHRVYNIKYGDDRSPTSESYMIYPQDLHAHQVIIREYMKQHNYTPLEMSQYAIPSRMAAKFWGKLGNNVLVADPTLTSKEQVRKMHIDEKSTMMARLATVAGVDEVFYWDAERDGRIKDYEWS